MTLLLAAQARDQRSNVSELRCTANQFNPLSTEPCSSDMRSRTSAGNSKKLTELPNTQSEGTTAHLNLLSNCALTIA